MLAGRIRHDLRNWWPPKRGRSPQRDATKDERASVVGEFLFAVTAFLAHEADGIELFDSMLRQPEGRKYGLKRVERQWLPGGR